MPDRIAAPEIDETPARGELPRAYCRRITDEKLAAIAVAGDEVLLCADTTVAVGRRILGKPADEAEARRFLELLSGRRHSVVTAVGVRGAGRTSFREVVTRVMFRRLGQEDIARYLATEDWRGKAGAYAIQGPAGAFIPWIAGSYTAVIGLPVAETAGLLRAAGYEWGTA